jgi:16S rRNA (cytidine1402-2'-O)-methyltransferase
MARGTLYLVPAPLDFGCEPQPLQHVLPAGTLATAARLGHWIAENAKTARGYLKRVNQVMPLAQPLQALQIAELPRAVHKQGDHGGGFDARPLLAPALDGHDIGLVSEAGMPAIADPGSSVVRAAHELGLDVVPLVGPVSLLMALAASGLNGQNFAFVGYVPQQPAPRAERLRELESLARRTGQAQLFIETPYRNAALWQALLETLRGDTRVGFATGLTLPQAMVRTRTVAQWKREPHPAPGDAPTVFLLGT